MSCRQKYIESRDLETVPGGSLNSRTEKVGKSKNYPEIRKGRSNGGTSIGTVRSKVDHQQKLWSRQLQILTETEREQTVWWFWNIVSVPTQPFWDREEAAGSLCKVGQEERRGKGIEGIGRSQVNQSKIQSKSGIVIVSCNITGSFSLNNANTSTSRNTPSSSWIT